MQRNGEYRIRESGLALVEWAEVKSGSSTRNYMGNVSFLSLGGLYRLVTLCITFSMFEIYFKTFLKYVHAICN